MIKYLTISGRSFEFNLLQTGIWYSNCTHEVDGVTSQCMLLFLECSLSDLGLYFHDSFDGPTLVCDSEPLYHILRHGYYVFSAYDCIPPVTFDINSICDTLYYSCVSHHLVRNRFYDGNSSILYSVSTQLPSHVKQ